MQIRRAFEKLNQNIFNNTNYYSLQNSKKEERVLQLIREKNI